MKIKPLLAATMLAAGSLGLASVSNAARVVEFDVNAAPPEAPPNVVVTTPAPREGYIYEPGHYGWDGQRYVWIDNQYIPNREGHHWQHYSLERHGDKWHYRAGHWDDDD